MAGDNDKILVEVCSKQYALLAVPATSEDEAVAKAEALHAADAIPPSAWVEGETYAEPIFGEDVSTGLTVEDDVRDPRGFVKEAIREILVRYDGWNGLSSQDIAGAIREAVDEESDRPAPKMGM